MAHALLTSPLRSYGGADSAATLSKQRSGHRVLMKISLALTTTCTLLFLIVFVPRLHSHFYLISGSSASAHGVQYSPSDLAGLSDRIVPYKTRIGYFIYAKPLTDDRVIAVYPPHFVPGADVRDEVPALRGMRPGIREEYVDDVYPVVLRITPKIPTEGMVSLIGLRFGKSGSQCKCNFGGVDSMSCEVKSPELAVIQLPAGAHFQITREANMQPAFIEVKLNSNQHFGVSRIPFGAVADLDVSSSQSIAAPSQDAVRPLKALARTQGAVERAAADRKHIKLPYKEVSNVTTEDIEKIIARAKEDGVT